MEHYQCPICGGAMTGVRYKIGDYSIRQCHSCGHGSVSPLPTSTELADLYLQQERDSLLGNGLAQRVAEVVDREEGAQRHFGERLQMLDELRVGSGARILDFGCANGAFVQSMHLMGYQHVAGFDIASKLVEEGRQRWNLDLHTGAFDDFCASHAGGFDFVFATNVFEHLADPLLTLAHLKNLLAPRGHVAISVPNFRSLQVAVSGSRSPIIDPPHHVHYFTVQSLEMMLLKTGFDVLSRRTPFWSRESDLYLETLGIPRWIAQAVRWAARIPGLPIQGLGLGGVAQVIGTRRR